MKKRVGYYKLQRPLQWAETIFDPVINKKSAVILIILAAKKVAT